MSDALSSVLVKFTADISDLQNKMEQVMSKIEASGQRVEEKTGFLSRSIKKIGDIAPIALGAVSTALGGISAWKGVQFNAEMEQAAISFETLLKSADKAKEMLRELQKFGAETPYEFPDLQKSAKLLLAMGMDADKLLPSLRNVGDAVAAIGGNGEVLEGVSRALGQMLTKGKVSAEEMAQMAERGLPVWDILAKKLGKSTAEVMKLSETGKLLASDVVPLLIEGFGERFGGAMEKQSKTFTGMLSTLADNVNMLLGEAMKPLFDMLVKLMPVAIDFVDRVMKGLADKGMVGVLEAIFPQNVANTIVAIGTAVKATFGFLIDTWPVLQPILVFLGAWLAGVEIAKGIKAFREMGGAIAAVQKAMQALNASMLLNPWVLGIAAVAAAAFLVWKYWEPISQFFINLWNTVKTKTVAAWESLTGWLSAKWDAITAVVTGLVAGVVGAWDSLVGGVKAAVGWLVDLFDRIKYGARALWDILTGGPEDVHLAFEFLGQSFGSVVNKIADFLYAIRQTVTDVFGFISVFVRAWCDFQFAVLSAGWEIIKTLFATAILVIYNLVTGNWSEIGKVFAAAKDKLVGIISDLWATIREIWTHLFEYVKFYAVLTWEAVKAVFFHALDAIQQYLVSAWESIKAAFWSALEWVKTAWSNAWAAVRDFLARTWENIKATVHAAWEGIKWLFTDGVRQAKELVVNGFNALVSWLWGLPARAGDAIRSTARTITDIARSIDLWSIGCDIVRGLWNGIEAMGDWLWRKVKGFFSNITKWAKDVLGIHSPSRVFMELGRFTSEGYAIGIEDNTKLAVRAAGGMALASANAAQGVIPTFSHRPAFSAEVASRSGSEGVVGGFAGGLNIHVAQLVVREEADVQKVAEQLYRLQRRGLRAKGVG